MLFVALRIFAMLYAAIDHPQQLQCIQMKARVASRLQSSIYTLVYAGANTDGVSNIILSCDAGID